MKIPNGLKLLNDKYEIALYIHIPFCKSKCAYCDFYSITPLKLQRLKTSSEEIEKMYINRLIEEYTFFLNQMQNVTIRTVYVGGGTPSFLNPHTLEKLFGAIISVYERITGKNFAPEEWTIEANPESLSSDFINLCKTYPVTRLSLGIQSLQEKFLKILNRPGNLNHNLNAITDIKNKWDRDVNFDIISGIPGQDDYPPQTEKELLHDLHFLADLEPAHISLYSLTIENGTPLYKSVKKNEIKLPDTDDADKLWFAGKSTLEERGYENYEISNFAQKGKESKHNLCYWELNPYLGLGTSAVSTLPLIDINGDTVVGRIRYRADLRNFLKRTNSITKTEKLTKKDFLFENLMMGFRLQRGISKEIFKQRFKRDLFEILPQYLNSPCFEENPLYYQLTEKCRFLLNKFLIDLGTQMEMVQESQIQVEWPLDKHPER